MKRTLTGILALVMVLSANSRGQGQEKPKVAVSYWPTPHEIVDKMLELAKVTRNDVGYDLGCGDGRIVVAAAKKHGARAVGVDIDPALVQQAQAKVKSAKVEDLVTIRKEAVDLSKIERTMRKEPVYESKNPKYCLLVFGPDAKTRMWLVVDGKVLYMDKKGDGDLTGPDKRVELAPKRNNFLTGPFSLADGKFQYSSMMVRVKDKGRVEIYLDRKVALAHRKKWGKDSLTQMAGLTDISSRGWMDRANIEEYDFRFADRPQDAPIVHFDGPLTLRPMDTKQGFVRGDKPLQFPVMVGTPGLGKGTFTQVLFWEGDPDGAAEIAFPHRNPDAKPIVVNVTMKSPG